MVSTDLSYESIVVQKRHVDIAAMLLESIYNNQTFKLKEVVEEERKQIECTLSDIEKIKEMVTRHPTMMAYLEKNSNVAKSTLVTVSGLDSMIFNEAMQQLARHSFVTMTQFKIFPTPKLLIALKKVHDM
jgi:hypothetical protein